MSTKKNIFLIANYLAVPKDPSQTSKAGYMQNPDNIHYQEQVVVQRGLRDRDTKNNVILNLTEEKIVKNSFKTSANFQTVFEHYYNNYSDYIASSVDTLNGKPDQSD